MSPKLYQSKAKIHAEEKAASKDQIDDCRASERSCNGEAISRFMT